MYAHTHITLNIVKAERQHLLEEQARKQRELDEVYFTILKRKNTSGAKVQMNAAV